METAKGKTDDVPMDSDILSSQNDNIKANFIMQMYFKFMDYFKKKQ